MLFVIILPSCYYSSLLQYSDRTVQNTTLTSFPFITYYAASHKVATPISTQRTNFRPKRVENGFTKSKPGTSPLFPAIKTTQKTSSRRRRLCNGKVGRKSCLSSFFLLSFFFFAPFFYSNVSKLVLRTYEVSIEFFSLCFVLWLLDTLVTP